MIKYCFLCLLVWTLTGTAVAQSSIIAYVDVEAIIQQMPAYRKAKNILETYQAQQRKVLDTKTKDAAAFYMDVVDKMKAGLLSQQQQQEAEAKLQEMQSELDLLKLQIDRGLVKKERELTKPMYDKFKKTVAEVAKQNNYHYIIDKQFILGMGTSGIDATAAIKKALGL